MADVKIYDDISAPEQVEEITEEKINDIKTDEVKEDIKDIEERVDNKLEEIKAEKTELNEDRVIFETKKAIEDMKNEIIEEVAYTRDKLEEKTDEIKDVAEDTLDEEDINTAIENAVENEQLDKETDEKPKKVNPFLIGAVAFGTILVAFIMCRPRNKENEEGSSYGY